MPESLRITPSPGASYPPTRLPTVADLAIDLGTANTLVHAKGAGVVLNEPSVVAVDAATGDVRAIGVEAKRMLGRTPDGLVAIRPVRDGVISDVDMVELMLRSFIESAMPKRYLFRTRPRVVVGVPTGLTEMERRAVRAAVLAAGARDVFLLAEPMAAAIGVGLPVATSQASMVVSVGGGTTEIGVIALSGVVRGNSVRVAGDALDNAIKAFVRMNHNVLIGDESAERLKIGIGSAFCADGTEELEMEVRGRDMVTGIPRTVVMTSTDVRETLREPLEAVIGGIRRVLQVTPPELAADLVEHGVVITGGGSLLKGIDALVASETGLPVRRDEEPFGCVVRGAGIVLEEWREYHEVVAA